MTTRPFRILGLQQVAIGGPDKAPLRKLWVDVLGLEPHGTYRSERENVDEDIIVAGAGPFRVEVDLMQPVDPNGKPRVHDPALNHLGLWVDDLRAAVTWLEGQGVRFAPGGIRKGAAGHDISTDERLADDPVDAWLKPYERKGDTAAAMNEYLSWEIDLVERIERDGTTRFSTFA